MSRPAGRVEQAAVAGSAGAPWWCERCGREVPAADARVMKSGRLRCPECKRRLVEVRPSAVVAPAGQGVTAEADDAPTRPPWHFKLLAVGTVGYLIYRLIWFIFWLTGHAWHG